MAKMRHPRLGWKKDISKAFGANQFYVENTSNSRNMCVAVFKMVFSVNVNGEDYPDRQVVGKERRKSFGSWE